MNIPVQNQDSILIEGITQLSSTTLDVTISMLDHKKQYRSWHERIPIQAAYTLVSHRVTLPAGTLLMVALSTTDGNCITADLYARASLHHQDPATDPVGIPLLSGYVTRMKALIWPGTPPQGPREGPGKLVFTDTSGAVGQRRVDVIPPQNSCELVTGGEYIVTTSSATGNRYPAIWTYRPSDNKLLAQVYPPNPQPANTTYGYSYGLVGTMYDSPNIPQAPYLPISPNIISDGFGYSFYIAYYDSGDQIIHIYMRSQRWIYI